MKILGIVQKAERDPQDLVFGDSCKKAESDPQRYYGKVRSNLTVKEYMMRTIVEGRRQTYGTDNRAVWGATAIKSSI